MITEVCMDFMEQLQDRGDMLFYWLNVIFGYLLVSEAT